MRRSPAATLLALALPFLVAATPIARVLQEDPPLPGESLVGWEPLDPRANTTTGNPLDVDEAVAKALANSPELRALEAGVTAARGGLLDAKSLPNPDGELALYTNAEEHTSDLPLAIGGEFDVTEVVLSQLRAASARPEVDAARLRLEEGRVRLGYEARAAFYDHQAAVAVWGASLRAVDALAASRDTTRALTTAGNGPTRERALREVAYEESRLRAATLELDVVATRERLARLLREAPGPVSAALVPVPATLSLPADLEGDAVAASLELRALDASILAARRRTTTARLAGLAPDLDLLVGSERDGDAWNTTVGLGVSVPMFSLGRGDALRSSADVELLFARREQAEIDVRSSAREAELRLASAHRRALHAQDVLVPLREDLLRETLLHYNAMQVGIDPLLDAWRARVEVEAAYADTLRELAIAQAALDALLAGAVVDGPRPAASPRSASNDSGGH